MSSRQFLLFGFVTIIAMGCNVITIQKADPAYNRISFPAYSIRLKIQYAEGATTQILGIIHSMAAPISEKVNTRFQYFTIFNELDVFIGPQQDIQLNRIKNEIEKIEGVIQVNMSKV